MGTTDHKRKRSQTVSFWMSEEERTQLEARIAVCGIPKGEYLIQSLLHQQIAIYAGKFHSDRLSIELRKLREVLETMDCCATDTRLILMDCRALLGQLVEISDAPHVERGSADDVFSRNKEESPFD